MWESEKESCFYHNFNENIIAEMIQMRICWDAHENCSGWWQQATSKVMFILTIMTCLKVLTQPFMPDKNLN